MSVRKSQLSGSNSGSYFSPFVDESSPNLVPSLGSDCSFQLRFPIDDILFQSGDIRDQSTKSEILMFLGPKVLGEGPQNF